MQHSENEEKFEFIKKFQKDKNINENVQGLLLRHVIENCGTPISVSDHTDPEEPLIYCNKAFEELTGYTYEEIVGKNCRFLQGDKTEAKAVEELRSALTENRACEVTFLNYRKDGSTFMNRLDLSPVEIGGEVLFYLGLQNQISHQMQI
jgi:PAS domain S-box-containing protein